MQWCRRRGFKLPPKVLICWKSGKKPWKCEQNSRKSAQNPENPNKIPKHLGKVPENLAKNDALRCLTSKNGTQRLQKNKWRPFFGGHTKKLTAKVAWQLLGQVWENLGKNPLHPHNFSCSCTYGFMHLSEAIANNSFGGPRLMLHCSISHALKLQLYIGIPALIKYDIATSASGATTQTWHTLHWLCRNCSYPA